MSIDHVSVGVTNIKRSKAFYDAALAPLDMAPVMPGKPSFWIQLPINGQPASMGNGVHIAFRATTRGAVDAFYLAAIEQGGIEDGKPGLRTEYHPDYYGAFVRDPDGNKIEACAHTHD
jgi:catechol 2,3-dioxygenase-like lactoylglutathione lyase family enzyme